MKDVINILRPISLLLVLLGLLSCSKETVRDNVRSKDISFYPVSLPAVKSVTGPVTPGTGYPDDEIFGVFSYYSPKTGSWSASDLNSSILYIDKGEFKKQDAYWGGWKEGAAHPYYWPLGGSLIFAGYSPYYQADGVSPVNVVFDAPAKTLSFPEYVVEDYVPRTPETVTAGNLNGSQSDLMYFLPRFDLNNDFIGVRNPNDAYDAMFYHSLSLVCFRVKAKSSGDVDKIDLHSLVLKNVVHKGSFSVVAETSAAGLPEWTLDRDDLIYTKDIVVFDAGKKGETDNGLVLSDVYSSIAEILIIPGLTHDIEIEYRLHVTEDRMITEKAVIKPAEIGIAEWLIGKRYTYDLVLGVDDIEIIPALDEWK